MTMAGHDALSVRMDHGAPSTTINQYYHRRTAAVELVDREEWGSRSRGLWDVIVAHHDIYVMRVVGKVWPRILLILRPA
jgi:hypothetical protein